MYGINDSESYTVDTFNDYVKYIQLIIRRYVAWGCGVVLHTTTPRKFMANDQASAQFSNAIRMLADDYGCPVFESETTVKYASEDGIYSDTTHFNAHGYNKYGRAVSAFIAAGGWVSSAREVSGTNTFYIGDSSDRIGFWATDGVNTGAGNSSDVLCNNIATFNGEDMVTYAFYMGCEVADLYLIGTLEDMNVTIGDILNPTFTRR